MFVCRSVCGGALSVCVCDTVIAAVSSRNVYLLEKLNHDL